MIIGIPDKRIDSKDDQIWLRFGIVDEVEIDEFLLFDIFGLHVLQDVGKETADIFRENLR